MCSQAEAYQYYVDQLILRRYELCHFEVLPCQVCAQQKPKLFRGSSSGIADFDRSRHVDARCLCSIGMLVVLIELRECSFVVRSGI